MCGGIETYALGYWICVMVLKRMLCTDVYGVKTYALGYWICVMVLKPMHSGTGYV